MVTQGSLWVALGLVSLAIGMGCGSKTDSEASKSGEGRPSASLSRTSPPPPEVVASHQRMVRELAELAKEARETGIYVGEAAARQWRQRLSRMDETTPLREQCRARFILGQFELRLGHERRAVDLLTQALELLSHPSVPQGTREQVTFLLAVAYLRLAERENCCERHTPDSCLLPIRGGGIHTKREGSEQAIRYLKQILGSTQRHSAAHLRARWLLNLASMTLGSYPAGVPQEYLIPASSFESKEKFPRFVNVASPAGVDTFSLAGGAIADDFDNDGYLDLVVSSWDPSGQLRFFHNDRSGKFEELTEEAGLFGIAGGLNLVQADFDNDGNTDVLVLRGGWLNGPHPNSLLRNLGGGRFVDVTYAAGLGKAHYPTQSASWADYDNDGDVDLYIANETSPTLEAPCQLFRNNGDGTFTDVAGPAGVANGRFAKAAVWGDYDKDRWPDLYVSNYGQPNRLYHNDGQGSFTDVAPALRIDRPIVSFPTWFWDYDNDGHLDLYVAGYATRIEHLAASHLELPHGAELARLYRGDGHGGFRDVAPELGLTRPSAPMGANFGDLDADGYLDFYLGTGWPDFHELMPNLLYRNHAGQGFADVTTAAGFGHLQKGHAVAFADFDHDGDEDVFEQMGGFYRADGYFDSLYRNPGFGARWLSLKLVGVRSNRSAIGTRIRIDLLMGDGGRRSIYREVNSGGSFGANPLRQFVGLGKATAIDTLEIFWPASSRTQTFRDVPLERHLVIVETEERFTVRELKSFRIGGP